MKLPVDPRRRPRLHQRQLAFRERAECLDWWFKRAIVLTTLALIALAFAATRAGRDAVQTAVAQGSTAIVRWTTGLEPDDTQRDEARRQRRNRTAEDTRRSLRHFYDTTTPALRRMFDACAMNPETGLIGVGRADNGFLLSSAVFAPDGHGRSYRLRANEESVWLRQVTLIGGPFGLFLVPDTPEARAAAGAAGAIVDETSRQTTNSWGLRGPEPDPGARVRGIALGDSFMMGMFNDDAHTPPLDLEHVLRDAWGTSVSVLNTGHIGYAPEQYYHTLVEYGARFRPHFVVVSVCPNDFGDGDDVLQGRGNDWDEAARWIGEIMQWCRGQMIPCLLVPAPVDRQILGTRKDAYYPGRVSNLFPGSSLAYCNPFDEFIDAHLEALRDGAPPGRSVLFNHAINDNHFSPHGSRLWAEIVGRRLRLLMKPPEAVAPPSSDQGQDRRVVEPGHDAVGLRE
jgi:hypothetical protein